MMATVSVIAGKAHMKTWTQVSPSVAIFVMTMTETVDTIRSDLELVLEAEAAHLINTRARQLLLNHRTCMATMLTATTVAGKVDVIEVLR